MDRQRYLRMRRWMPLFILLRVIVVAGMLFGAHTLLSWIIRRSDLEVAALKNRPKSNEYLRVDKPIKMTVIDDEGNLSMEIEGESLKLSSDQRVATFTGARARYFENGEESLRMEAGQIEYDTFSEDFHLTNKLSIDTRDGMHVEAEEVEWRRFKGNRGRPGQAPAFRFPQGVYIVQRSQQAGGDNVMSAKYMQADKELMYMEFVGNFQGTIGSLQDTQFITERKLTDVENLKLEDFEKLFIAAEQVIYDKRNQVVLATSRFYDKAFRIKDFDGNIVQPDQYQPDAQQVLFKKKDVSIGTNHLEAHIGRKWAACLGNITMIIPPTEPMASDDKALRTMRRYETRLACGDIEYYWGRDYVVSHDRTRVEQDDRLALADRITYWGDKKMVLLDGNIAMVQGSGQWMFDAELVGIKNQDQARMLKGYSELTADRSVIYINNNDFIASGSVLARQDNRETTCETLVYQDSIKRITAQKNVKFVDSDGQTFLCNELVYNNESGYMEIRKGMTTAMRLPARFANDINRTIAESRELPIPADTEDPPVPEEPSRNPNQGSQLGESLESQLMAADSLPPPRSTGTPPPPIAGSAPRGPLFIPDSGSQAGSGPQQIIMKLSDTEVETGQLTPPSEPAEGNAEGETP